MENILGEMAQLLSENIAIIGVVGLLTVTFMSCNITDAIMRLFQWRLQQSKRQLCSLCSPP